MDNSGLSLRKLATVLGVSQPFLSQIRAGKRPLPEALKKKVEALGAYHLLITPVPISGDKQTVGGGLGGVLNLARRARLVTRLGVEPRTYGLRVRCSAN